MCTSIAVVETRWSPCGYDQANQLTSITGVEGTTTTYTYAATGLRATATTGATTEQYTWDTLAGIPLLLTDHTHAYLYGNGSVPLAQIDLTDGTVDYLHTDTLGSVRSTTDATGAVTSDADYDTYGQAKAVTTASSSQVTRFGYAGEYTDPTGYLYLRARYYDPAGAQFLTCDPLEATTSNPYGYTDGNPPQFTDSLGLDWYNPTTWTAGTWDNVSAGLGVAALVLAATGVGAPVALVLGGLAIASAGAGAYQHYQQGNCGMAAMAAIGMIPGVGGVGRLAARGALEGVELAARSSATVGSVSRAAGAADGGLVNLASSTRTSHILDGEVRPNGPSPPEVPLAAGTGPGFPGKSEFPASWSDAQIMDNISEIATDPALVWRAGAKQGDFWVNGTRNGTDIEVLVRNGDIWTAYPTSAARNP